MLRWLQIIGLALPLSLHQQPAKIRRRNRLVAISLQYSNLWLSKLYILMRTKQDSGSNIRRRRKKEKEKKLVVSMFLLSFVYFYCLSSTFYKRNSRVVVVSSSIDSAESDKLLYSIAYTLFQINRIIEKRCPLSTVSQVKNSLPNRKDLNVFCFFHFQIGTFLF